jgi:hypothetical protein
LSSRDHRTQRLLLDYRYFSRTTPAGPHLVTVPVAANGRPTGSLEFPTSINGKKLVLQLYSGTMEALGGYEVDLGSSY